MYTLCEFNKAVAYLSHVVLPSSAMPLAIKTVAVHIDAIAM